MMIIFEITHHPVNQFLMEKGDRERSRDRQYNTTSNKQQANRRNQSTFGVVTTQPPIIFHDTNSIQIQRSAFFQHPFHRCRSVHH
jgi:hypothetical protein